MDMENLTSRGGTSRIIVVSNRIGPVEEGKSAPGGLAVGVYEILRSMGGIWFGWSGTVADQSSVTPNLTQDRNITYATIDLGRKDYAEFYTGFSNSTLWPLLHFRTGLLDFERDCLEGYLRVNELFADHLIKLIKPNDIIWVHDYHLIPLAAALRRKGAKNRIGFFLHTPLPPRAVLQTLPDHGRLLRTLAAYDLVGLQTEDDATHFNDYMRLELGATAAGATLLLDRRQFRAGTYPIGIDPAGFARTADVASGQSATRKLQRSLGDRKMVIGVDRLDYSKGLPLRMKAIDRLFSAHSNLRDRVTFLQIATISRSDVRQYRDLRDELDAAAGHINGRYAEADWTPVRYVNRNVNRNTLAGYFRCAHVGLVTPLRDGMNLVAKEYVAAQDPEDPGVLVLSPFAGAAHELKDALQVNPFDVDAMVEAIAQALVMPLAERRRRWRSMMAALQKQTVRHWATSFIDNLKATRTEVRRVALAQVNDDLTVA